MCCYRIIVQKAGDRGSLARASGDYCIVVAHNPETGVSRIKLPSGSKKVCRPELCLNGRCRLCMRYDVLVYRSHLASLFCYLVPCVTSKFWLNSRNLHGLKSLTRRYICMLCKRLESISYPGSPQVLPSTCRAMVGQVAGGGRTEKPLLKAGNAYHKFKVKRNSWPKVRTPGHPSSWRRWLVESQENQAGSSFRCARFSAVGRWLQETD